MPFGEVDRIAKLMPETLGITLDPGHRAVAGAARPHAEADGQVARLIETARRLEGLTRHASTHAAGVVIGNRPLIDDGPALQGPQVRRRHVPVDMEGCVEQVGLVKFDFLGLKTLTVIADAERMIRSSSWPDFDASRISLDDEVTYDLLCSRRHRGRVPGGVLGHDRAGGEAPAAGVQGGDPPRRPLPARAPATRAWWTTTSAASTGDQGRVPPPGASRSSPRRPWA